MRYIIMFLLIFNSFVFAEPKFLMPEEAFQATAHLKKRCTINATIELGHDIYLYQSKVSAKIVEKNSGIVIDRLVLPEGVDHDGEKVYLTSPSIDIALAKTRELDEIVPITLVLSYQGCSEQGLC
ncbi:MAG TPA: protein-disulfide reductase DsbD N-terminal domain-containing protein, partial [Sulfuricurvum sp.]|nr:protein-disulfide reductase DsbD N-terminal domain-containing protein [Sulfuricurvum sp.]